MIRLKIINFFNKTPVQHLLVFLVFVGFVIIITLPLILHLNDMILGTDADNLYFVWLSWWFKTSIFDFHVSPLQTDYIFYPQGVNLLGGFHGMLGTYLASFLQFFTAPLVAYNLTVILLLAISALTTYLLIRYLTNNVWVSFLAGIMMAFSPYLFSRALGHLHILTFFCIPLFILYLLKYWEKPNKRYLLLGTLFYILNVYSDWYYAVFLTIFVIIFLIVKFVTNRKEFYQKCRLKHICIFISTVIVFILPLSYVFLRANQSHIKAVDLLRISFVYTLSADLIEYIIPNPQQLLSNQFFNHIFHSFKEPSLTEHVNFIGFITLGLVILFFLKKKKSTTDIVWIITFLFFIYLSLGIVMILLGHDVIELPYYLLIVYLPAAAILRVPARYGSMVILSSVIMSSLVLVRIFQLRIMKNKLIYFLFFLLLLSGIIIERIYFPMILTRLSTPNFYQQLALEKESFAILELPAHPNFNSLYNFYQITHQKKLVYGRVCSNVLTDNTVRFFQENFDYSNYTCLANNNIDNARIEEKIALFQKNKIKYIILNKKKMTNKACRLLIHYFKKNYQPYYYFEDDDMIVYKTY